MGKQVSLRAGGTTSGHEESPGSERTRLGNAHARSTTLIGIALVAVLVVAGLVFVVLRGQQTPVTSKVYSAIDRIPCQSASPSGIHIHAHVTIYINGTRIPIPAYIGIASDRSCLYWLHTHDASGIIHVEAPSGSSFILGNFLDIWSQRFQQLGYPNQLADPTGWQAYVGGQRFTGDLRDIPLERHTLITLAYNSPGVTPDTSYPWDDL
jgi:hypothetical protein